DDVAANLFFRPAIGQGALDGLHVAFGSVGRFVIKLVAVFSQGDAGADRVADHIVFDDPAFAPMRADEADLLGGGRRPGRRGMTHGESADRDVVHAGLRRIEYSPAHVDLYELFIRVDIPKLSPER